MCLLQVTRAPGFIVGISLSYIRAGIFLSSPLLARLFLCRKNVLAKKKKKRGGSFKGNKVLTYKTKKKKGTGGLELCREIGWILMTIFLGLIYFELIFFSIVCAWHCLRLCS